MKAFCQAVGWTSVLVLGLGLMVGSARSFDPRDAASIVLMLFGLGLGFAAFLEILKAFEDAE